MRLKTRLWIFSVIWPHTLFNRVIGRHEYIMTSLHPYLFTNLMRYFVAALFIIAVLLGVVVTLFLISIVGMAHLLVGSVAFLNK